MPGHFFPFWTYIQLRHFLDKPRLCPEYSRQRTPFESLCTRKELQIHLISDLYAILFSDINPKSNIASRKWERELVIDLSDDEWENIFFCIHKGTINVSTQENGFKVFSRWYKTSLRLHKISPAILPNCWHCSDKEGSLLNISRCCPIIQPFWTEVHRLITHITTYSIDFSPAQMLLHPSSTHQKDYKHSLTLHLVNTARMTIPAKWKSPNSPTIVDWLRHINRVEEMEDLVHQANDTSYKFLKT